MNIAERIQCLRKMKGISQEELADKMGVSRQAVSKWENEQSIPDLEKVILMSEYFDVTTDYILKGRETSDQLEKKNYFTSQILYITSTAFIAIGLLSAFAGWYSEQSAESIWGSMIIQVVGAVAYYIGRLISQSKAPFIVNWLNIIIALFMPVSLVVTFFSSRVVAPYPTDIITGIAFAAVYIILVIFSYIALKKNRE